MMSPQQQQQFIQQQQQQLFMMQQQLMQQQQGQPPNGVAPFGQPAPPFPLPQQQQQGPPQVGVQPSLTMPEKPLDEGLCKFGTECKFAYCKFAHPSPAATKESGLVLSAEPCEKQIDCDDPVC